VTPQGSNAANPDLAKARAAMVESQLRTSDVFNPVLVNAFRAVPREVFVPAAQRHLAYAEVEAEFAPGRRLLAPRDLGKLLEALAPQPGDNALELAGGSGYGAAILGQCVKTVVTLDPSPELSLMARAALDQVGCANVTAVCTDTKTGWPDGAPFDLIVLNGAAEFVPQAWLDQLAEGGKLAVIIREGVVGQARLYVKSGGQCAFRPIFDARPALAPGLERAKSFAF
jgi:protein-L-isoaspartate(D-aspartate) O-methyltransferase